MNIRSAFSHLKKWATARAKPPPRYAVQSEFGVNILSEGLTPADQPIVRAARRFNLVLKKRLDKRYKYTPFFPITLVRSDDVWVKSNGPWVGRVATPKLFKEFRQLDELYQRRDGASRQNPIFLTLWTLTHA